jgi:uncharacterized damage-inducible protein DinB
MGVWLLHSYIINGWRLHHAVLFFQEIGMVMIAVWKFRTFDWCYKFFFMSTIRSQSFLHELNSEYRATLDCLKKIPENLFEYKPHPKSMNMGYLALLVAEIPLWIKHMVIDGEIDLVSFKHFSPKTNTELLAHFEENMQGARSALENTSDEELQAPFFLKANGQLLYASSKVTDISVTLNHWVHHRGQLTVYMRLNDIPVPSIYGPSADDKNFTVPK